MAFSEIALLRFRDALGARTDIEQKRMMGGMVFMAGGHMVGGVDQDKSGGDRFMFRVGVEAAIEAVTWPGASQVMMGTRPMKGFVFVDATECTGDELVEWIRLAMDYISSLPKKDG